LQRKSLVAVNKISCYCKQILLQLETKPLLAAKNSFIAEKKSQKLLALRSFSDPPPSLAKCCKTLCLNHAGVKFKIISSYFDFEGPLYTHLNLIEV
jgi:hypothetical protein